MVRISYAAALLRRVVGRKQGEVVDGSRVAVVVGQACDVAVAVADDTLDDSIQSSLDLVIPVVEQTAVVAGKQDDGNTLAVVVAVVADQLDVGLVVVDAAVAAVDVGHHWGTDQSFRSPARDASEVPQ